MSKQDDKMRQEIERDEQWLASQMAAHPAPECSRLDAIREQVRMAVHLESLDVAPPVPPTAEVLAGVKAAIRSELGAPSASMGPRSPRAWMARQPWIAMVGAAGLAAAACLVLVVTSRSLVVPGDSQRFAAVSPLVEFIDVINTNGASGVPAGDEITAALVSSADEQTDARLDELADELDELLAELNEPFDV